MSAALRAPAALLLAAPWWSSCVISIGGFSSWQPDPVWVEEAETRHIGGEGVSRLSCTTRNGDVRSEAGSGPGFDVVVRKRAGGRDEAEARACLAAIEVTEQSGEGEVALGWRWAGSHRSDCHASVAFEIRQPAGVELVVESENGGIEAAGLAGGVRLKTTNGSIDVRDCRGPARATTDNGHIEAAVESREVHIASLNGDVDVRLLGAGSISGNVQSRNGSVSVAVAGGLSTLLVCSTENGRISLRDDLDSVLVRKRNVLVAELGGRDGTLQVETDNGSIVLR